MPDVAQIWSEALPTIKDGVTGAGVWTALNAAKPILIDNNVVVIGLPHQDGELAGHLRLPATKRLMDLTVSNLLNSPATVRVIDGLTPADWEVEKRRDEEKARLNQQAMEKMRAELASRTSWDAVYDQLARKYASVSNKSLPQNRARFFEEAVELIAEARKNQANYDELGERNFARCLERLAQYSEIPSAIVAREVLTKAGEL